MRPQDRETVENEARNIIKLSSSVPHPNLIRVVRHGFLTSFIRPPTNNGLPYYFIDMEVGRPSLSKYILGRFHSVPQNLPLPAEIWDILAQLASGIEFMHEKGVFHRDIKPDNRTATP
jgi:serine/threonine protein kinase